MPPKPKRKGKKKKKKRPDTGLKNYLEERDVLMPYLKLKELRGFSKKLYKTLSSMEKENERLKIEKEKLLAYWNIIDEKLRKEVDEIRKLEIQKLQKYGDDNYSVLIKRKSLALKCFQEHKAKLNFAKGRMTSKIILKKKIFNRSRELLRQMHATRKEYINGLVDDLKMDMYQIAMSKKELLPYLKEFGDILTQIQYEYYFDIVDSAMDASKKQVKLEMQALRKKNLLAKLAVNRLDRYKEAMRTMFQQNYRSSDTNTNIIKANLISNKMRYALLKKHEQSLRESLEIYEDPKVNVHKERNNMLSIIGKVKNVNISKRKVEKRYDEIYENVWDAKIKEAGITNKSINEEKFTRRVGQLAFEEADNAIINYMAKKLLPMMKTNILKKKIRTFYYILQNVLKGDADLDEITKQIVDVGKFIKNRNVVASLDVGLLKIRESMEAQDSSITSDDEKRVKNDPFGLNCIPDVQVGGFIPQISMHHTCKEIIADRKLNKNIDVHNRLPDELMGLLKENTKKNQCLRMRMMNVAKRNLIDADSVPIDIRVESAPTINKYIIDWEHSLQISIQKRKRNRNFIEEYILSRYNTSDNECECVEEEEEWEELEEEEEVEEDVKNIPKVDNKLKHVIVKRIKSDEVISETGKSTGDV